MIAIDVTSLTLMDKSLDAERIRLVVSLLAFAAFG